jgi:hypothetical protein
MVRRYRAGCIVNVSGALENWKLRQEIRASLGPRDRYLIYRAFF